MANTTTVTRTGHFITLVFAGTGADFLFSTNSTANPELATNQVKVASIMWRTAADGNKIVIRDGGSTGAILFEDEAADPSNARIKYYGGGQGGVRMNPSITVSQCSLGVGTLIFEIA